MTGIKNPTRRLRLYATPHPDYLLPSPLQQACADLQAALDTDFPENSVHLQDVFAAAMGALRTLAITLHEPQTIRLRAENGPDTLVTMEPDGRARVTHDFAWVKRNGDWRIILGSILGIGAAASMLAVLLTQPAALLSYQTVLLLSVSLSPWLSLWWQHGSRSCDHITLRTRMGVTGVAATFALVNAIAAHWRDTALHATRLRDAETALATTLSTSRRP
jgi:hypothetical protein